MIKKTAVNIGKRRTGRIAAAVAAAVLASTLLAQSGFAYPETGTIAVTIPADSAYDELRAENANSDGGIVVDLYRVASAKAQENADAFTFDWTGSAFSGAESTYNAIQEKSENGQTITAQDINAFTQQLAAIVLGSEGTVPAVTAAGAMGENIPAEAGMYLVLIHSRNETTPDRYREEAEADTPLTTVVDLGAKQYQFAPMLVTLPNRGLPEFGNELVIAGNEEAAFGAAAGNTANIGDGEEEIPWNNTISIEAKSLINEETEGKLRITKTLTNYETMGNRTERITCIFRIVATLDGAPVYNGVESVSVQGTAPGSVVIEHLPVGAQVIVTEEYAGGDYMQSAVTPSGPVTIIADDPATEEEEMTGVAFTNVYNGGIKGGGSVKNTYGTTAAEDGETWSWNSDPQPLTADDTSIR